MSISRRAYDSSPRSPTTFTWSSASSSPEDSEMLDRWERESVAEAIEQAEAGGGDARSKLRRLLALAASHDELLMTDLAVRDRARRRRPSPPRRQPAHGLPPLPVPRVLRRRGRGRVRCMTVSSLWIGNHFLAADHGPRTRADVMGLTLRRLLA